MPGPDLRQPRPTSSAVPGHYLAPPDTKLTAIIDRVLVAVAAHDPDQWSASSR
jgi:hypothetical protein